MSPWEVVSKCDALLCGLDQAVTTWTGSADTDIILGALALGVALLAVVKAIDLLEWWKA